MYNTNKILISTDDENIILDLIIYEIEHLNIFKEYLTINKILENLFIQVNEDRNYFSIFYKICYYYVNI